MRQKPLTISGIIPAERNKITTKHYNLPISIEGVKIIILTNNVEEDGDFGEIVRITNGNIENPVKFHIEQINRTKLNPNAVKAWHLHFRQNMLWYVSPTDRLFVGLWDIRKGSKTENNTMRIVLGGGYSQLLFLPKGVAHGSANFTLEPINLFYFTDHQFSHKNNDEKRLPWDACGASFWSVARD